MAYLHQHAYTAITVTQFIKARAHGASISSTLPERPVVLTFDDGYADFFTEALPVLKRYGFVATLYVPTAFVGGTSRRLQPAGESARRMLTWDQLIEISASGVECGGPNNLLHHIGTLTHPLCPSVNKKHKKIIAKPPGAKIFSLVLYSCRHTAPIS